MAAYSQDRLWYVSPTVIRFAPELGIDMAVPLVSTAIIRDLLNMLEVIESTRVDILPSSCTERVLRPIEYNSGGAGPCGEFFYCDSFERRKISDPVTRSLVAAMYTCPMNVFPGWVHNVSDVERTTRDSRRDFIPDHDPYPPAPTATVAPVSYTHLTLPTILLV